MVSDLGRKDVLDVPFAEVTVVLREQDTAVSRDSVGRWALAESSLVVVLHDGVKASIAGPGVIGLGVLIDATLETRDVAQIDAR